MSVGKMLTNPFSSRIRIWPLVNCLVLFLWKRHKNWMPTTLWGNIASAKINPWLHICSWFGRTKKICVEPLLGIPGEVAPVTGKFLLRFPASCAVEITAPGENEALKSGGLTLLPYADLISLHPNHMNSCKDSHIQGMPDAALLARWGSRLLSLW